MHNGRSRSSKVNDIYTNRKLYINFLLVINSNFGGVLHRFRYIAAPRWKNRFLPDLRCIEAPAWGGTLSEFLDETYPTETTGMGLLYGENCIILTSNAFDWSTSVTDRRTDGIAMAYTRNCIYAVARKNEYIIKPTKTTIGLHTNTNTNWRGLWFKLYCKRWRNLQAFTYTGKVVIYIRNGANFW